MKLGVDNCTTICYNTHIEENNRSENMINKFTIGWADGKHEYTFYITNRREIIGKQVNELHHMLDKNRIPYEYSFVKNGKEVIEMKVNV